MANVDARPDATWATPGQDVDVDVNEPLDESVLEPVQRSLSQRLSFDLGQGFPTGCGSPFEGPHEAKSPTGTATGEHHAAASSSDAPGLSAAGSLTRSLSRRLSILSEPPPIPEGDIGADGDMQMGGAYWTAVGIEFKRTYTMAVPLLINNLANFGVSIIVLSYIGHLGQTALACATLGGSLFNVIGQSLFIGCASTLETLCGQAVGAGKYRLLGLEMVRCMFLMTLSMPLFGLLYYYIGDILVGMGQDPTVARGAAAYLQALTPALWLMGMTECLKRGLTSRGIVLPNMTIALFTTLCTPFYAHFFVAYLGLGYVGAAYAVTAGYLSNLLCFLGTFLFVNWRTKGTPEYAWPGWTWDMTKGLGVILRIAFPTTMMICLDWWTWETMILLGGLLPNAEVSVAVMGLGFNIVAFCFMVPLAITATASIGIANFLGANQPRRARLAYKVALFVSMTLMSAISTLIFFFGGNIGRIYTNDPEVLEVLSDVTPVIAVILWMDAFQNTCTSALRGSGRQGLGAATNLSVLWLFGVPLAATLAFHFQLGVTGMWYGLLAAFTVQGFVMFTTVTLAVDMDREAGRAQARMQERAWSAEVEGGGQASEATSGGLGEPLLGDQQQQQP